jgi:alkanesulfonate monooxygenase SsuD/methylene tetrahydromethanopterin reductase-like flavin-dependent oxidoreductase (luciferase family)
MRFDTFMLAPSPSPADDFRVIEEQIDQVVAAEELGYSTAWLTEHHFTGDNGYSDPVIFAAALAGRTKTITIGFAVVQMSLHHPTRLAVQLSLLDNLLHGRLIAGLGKGSGFNEFEYAGFGLTSEAARDRMFESVELLERAWKGKNVSFHGKYFDAEIREIRPSSYTKPHPRFAIAVGSEESLRWSARHGYPVLFSFVSPAQMQQRIDVYTAEMTAAGWDQAKIAKNIAQVAITRSVYVAETDEQAQHDVLEPTYNLYDSLGALREAAGRREAAGGPKGELWSSPSATRDEAVQDLIRRTYLLGSPATVTKQVEALRQAGCQNLLCRMSWGAMDHQQVLKSMELFAKEVMPLFPDPVKEPALT